MKFTIQLTKVLLLIIGTKLCGLNGTLNENQTTANVHLFTGDMATRTENNFTTSFTETLSTTREDVTKISGATDLQNVNGTVETVTVALYGFENGTQISNDSVDSVSIRSDNITVNGSSDTMKRIALYIQMITVPITVVVGCFGNTITIVVMSTAPFNSMSWSLTLTFLAVADTGVLLLNALGRTFVISIIGVDVSAINKVSCKLIHFCNLTAKVASTWFVALICLERFVAICVPLKVKLVCTRKSTRIHVIVVWLVSFIVAGVSTLTVGFIDSRCLPGYYYKNQGLEQIKASILGVMPVSVLVILTPVTCIVLLVQMRKNRKLGLSTQPSDEKLKKVSLMLLIIVFMFLLLAMPNGVYSRSRQAGLFSPDNKTMQFVLEIIKVLELINHSCNFLVYTMCNQIFRKKIVTWFPRACKTHK